MTYEIAIILGIAYYCSQVLFYALLTKTFIDVAREIINDVKCLVGQKVGKGGKGK
jgi:hypothetical protein